MIPVSAAKPRAGSGKPRTGRAAPPAAPAGDGLGLLDAAARGDFPASLYVDGPDEALKAAFLSEFRRAWAGHVPEAPAARVMRPGENGVDEILSVYHGISMFTPRELVVVLDVEDLGRSEKRVAALAEGVRRPGGASCLVLVESAADAPRKMLVELRAAASVRWTAEPLAPRGLMAWGKRRLEAAGLAVEPGALEALLEVCENESVSFFNEVVKLVGWCAAAGKVTPADVAALSAPVVGADLAEYLAAVAAGHPGLAAQRLGRILAEGENESGVMFALGNLVGAALGGWGRYKALSAELARRRSPRDLAAALDAVYRAEAAWKGGRADVLSALEQATRDIAGG